jgi:hypothetical protein
MGNLVAVSDKARHAIAQTWPNAHWAHGPSRPTLRRGGIEKLIEVKVLKLLQPGESMNDTIVGLQRQELISWAMRETKCEEWLVRRIVRDVQRHGCLQEINGLKCALTCSGSSYINSEKPKSFVNLRSRTRMMPPREGRANRARSSER